MAATALSSSAHMRGQPVSAWGRGADPSVGQARADQSNRLCLLAVVAKPPTQVSTVLVTGCTNITQMAHRQVCLSLGQAKHIVLAPFPPARQLPEEGALYPVCWCCRVQVSAA